MRLPTLKVLTHNGKFHPDEIIALVMLAHFKESWLHITRSRDKDVIKRFRDKKRYIVDVGDVYDPPFSLDHHQESFDKVNSFGNQMSSCGIMWETLKQEQFITPNMISRIDEFVNNVDMHDNGVRYFKEIEFISLYNYEKKSETNPDSNFISAFKATHTYFKLLMKKWTYECMNEILHMDIISNDESYNADKTVIIIPDKISISEIINSTNAKLIVYKRNDEEYIIQSLNEEIEVNFSVRCPAPEYWLGKSVGELPEVPELVFCHKGGFITIVKSDLETAVKVAEMIVKYNSDKENV